MYRPTLRAIAVVALSASAFAGGGVLINEVDSDNPGTDMLEFVELYDGGVGNTALDGLVVVLFNGSSDTSYGAFDLDGFTTDANGYFLLGDSAVPGVGLVIGTSNALQNGADAVALYTDDDTSFPNGTAVTATNLVDAVVYGTGDPDATGLLAVLGGPQVDESANAMSTTDSCQRCPSGTGGPLNSAAFSVQGANPGGDCTPPPGPTVLINEVDADNPGTDTLEFVELYDGGAGSTPLDGLVVVLYNGSSDTSYGAFDLDGFSTDASGYFVLGDAALPGVDLVIGTSDTIQNGADAVALYMDNGPSFPNGTAVTATNLVDALVYGTGDADDVGLLAVLGGPQLDENANSMSTGDSSQRCPSGTGGPLNSAAFSVSAANPDTDCTPPPVADVLINEVDSDTVGSDALEFIELWDGGVGNSDLTGLVLVFYNGATDTVYGATDLDGLSTNGSGFFVYGNAAVPGVDLVFPDNSLQNGADAVALYAGDDTDFPFGSPVTLTDLVDAFVYDTDDVDDAGLLALLLPGEPQVNERGANDGTGHSSQRCPNGAGGARVTSEYVQALPTPGSNCTGPRTYCTGKTSSLGCVPFLTFNGTPSATNTGPFQVVVNDLLPNEFGFMIYGISGPSNLNFHGGKLCVKSPFARWLPVKASASDGPPPCTGRLVKNLNKRIQSGIDPFLTVGQKFNAQFRQRDAALNDGFNDILSDGLRLVINP